MNDTSAGNVSLEAGLAAAGLADGWSSFFKWFAMSAMSCLVLAALMVLLTNPYGNLPNTLFSRHVIVQGNQRFQYPAIARSAKFDSVLVGTSTSGILRPDRLNEVLGGRFANLAMDSARAWEQAQVAALFRRSNGPASSLIIGLDTVWCDPEAGNVRITERGFPEWMYDDNPWNDVLHMLNATALDYAIKRVRAAMGSKSPRVAPDGYKAFLPDEKGYDLDKVKRGMGPWHRKDYPAPSGLPQVDGGIAEPPALTWLDELLAKKWSKAALVFMPVHASAQPKSETEAFRVEQSCKARIAEVASRYKTAVVDFRLPSSITLEEANYWDKLHYRVSVGNDVAAHIAAALKSLQDDPEGRWRILNKSAAVAWE